MHEITLQIVFARTAMVQKGVCLLYHHQGKSLGAELQFCESVKDLLVKKKFNQPNSLRTHTVKSMLHCFLCLKKG